MSGPARGKQNRPPIRVPPSSQRSALELAREAAEACETWFDFQRALFGDAGRLGQHFTIQEELDEFLASRDFQEISQLAALRPLGIDVPHVVRLTPAISDLLRAEARACQTSVESLARLKLATPLPVVGFRRAV